MSNNRFEDGQKVKPSDFANAPPRLKSVEFKKFIPQLSLADIFLIEIIWSAKKKTKLIVYLRGENESKCMKCGTDNLNHFELYRHLYSDHHKFSVQENQAHYYHPVFTVFNHSNDPRSFENAITHANDLLYNIPRFIFLFAYARAKMVEASVVAKGLPLINSKIEFSGKRIVESATDEEFYAVWEVFDALMQETKGNFPVGARDENYSRMLQREIARGNPENLRMIPEKKKRRLEQIFQHYEENKSNSKHYSSDDIIVDGRIIDFDGISNTYKKELLKMMKLNSDDLFYISSLIGPIKEKGEINRSHIDAKISSVLNKLNYDKSKQLSERKTHEKPNVVSVLRLLVALENELDSLGPKLIDLLSKAVATSKTSNLEQVNSEILTFENCVLMETAVEKLKGSVEAHVLPEGKRESAIHVIKKTEDLLYYISRHPVQRQSKNFDKQSKSNQITGENLRNEQRKNGTNIPPASGDINNILERNYSQLFANKSQNYSGKELQPSFDRADGIQRRRGEQPERNYSNVANARINEYDFPEFKERDRVEPGHHPNSAYLMTSQMGRKTSRVSPYPSNKYNPENLYKNNGIHEIYGTSRPQQMYNNQRSHNMYEALDINASNAYDYSQLHNGPGERSNLDRLYFQNRNQGDFNRYEFPSSSRETGRY